MKKELQNISINSIYWKKLKKYKINISANVEKTLESSTKTEEIKIGKRKSKEEEKKYN